MVPHREIGLTVEDTPDPADVQCIKDELNAYNLRVTGLRDYRPLAIFLREEVGTIIGGLTGFTLGSALKIEHLWVRDELRRQGHGARLLATAEREAGERGCDIAVLDTFSFQAPKFYRRHGYRLRGATDWPRGHRQCFFQKRLKREH